MKNTRPKNLLLLTALAFLAGGIEQTHATPPDRWTLTGVSPGGGYIIVGTGTLNLGPLGPSSFPVHLSTNGSDSITLNAGSTASSGGAETIDIETTNNTLNNSGAIINTGTTGVAVYLDNAGNTLNNWGTISGAYEGVDSYGNGGIVNNWGVISGSYPVIVDANNTIFNNFASGQVNASEEYGFEIYGNGNVLNNRGSITDATNYALYIDANNTTVNNWGTITSPYDPIWIGSGSNNIINNWGSITATSSDYGIYNDGSNFTFNNWGTLSAFDSQTIFNNGSGMTVNNYLGGNIISFDGVGIYTEDSSANTINNWGTVTAAEEGVEIYRSSNNVLNNWGTVASSGNDGVYIDQSSHNAITNWGYIQGSLNGIEIFESSHNTINNWGQISGNQAFDIESSSHNTINLNGHSSAIGAIAIGGNNNVVNLNFTGLSPAAIAALNTQLAPQGVNSGSTTALVQFSLRGVNYDIDPATVNSNLSSYEQQAKTPNQFAIARNLDGLTTNPAPGTPFFNLLNAIDNSGNVPGALDAISPLKYAVYGELSIQNTTALVQGIDRRLNNLSDGSESVDTTSLGGDNTVAAVVTGDPSKDGSKDKQVVQPEAKENRWGFFASGNGLFFRGNGGNSLQDGKSNSAGTIAGVDGKVGDHAVIGALFAYNNSAVDLGNDGSHATIESYTGGIYGSYHQDGFYANSLAAYTRNNYTSSSNVIFPGFATTGNGSTHGNQYSANIDGGYDFNLSSRLTVGPIAGLQYVHLDVNGFNEEGGALALGDQSMNSLQSRLGAKAQYRIASTATSSTGIEVYAAWQHEYLDNSRGITASFEGSGLAPFAVQTGSPERDAAVVGAAVNFTFHKRLTLFADYELQMWNQSNFEQTINGGAKISF